MPENTERRKLSNCKDFYGNGYTKVHTAIAFAVAKNKLAMLAVEAESFREVMKEACLR